MLMQQLAIASKEQLRIPQRPRRPSPLLVDPHHRTNPRFGTSSSDRLCLRTRHFDRFGEQLVKRDVAGSVARDKTSTQPGYPGMKVSGKPMISALFFPASRIRERTFSVLDFLLRNTGEA
jgi:hypothetical protein